MFLLHRDRNDRPVGMTLAAGPDNFLGIVMALDTNIDQRFRCETCGNHYVVEIRRCPRCKSNQNVFESANGKNLPSSGRTLGSDRSATNLCGPANSR